MLVEIGLIFIILAWIYQIIKVSSGDKSVQPLSLGLYVIGSATLAFDAFSADAMSIAALNGVTLLLALGVFATMGKAK